MKRHLILVFIILGLITGCAYFQKKDEPPPLPPIEEVPPPLTMKAEYFKAFPWAALPKPKKDGNDPNTTTYTFKEGDTLESVAQEMMGDANLASGLASYNDISPTGKVAVGDKIVIPNPIIGMSNQILVKAKGEKEFGPPENFDAQLKKGDQYKLKFESNVDGYCYIFRQGPKAVELLYPAKLKTRLTPKKGKKGKKAKAPPPLMRDTGKVKVHETFEIPVGKKGFAYDAKRVGDQLVVFLSLQQVPELEAIKEKAKITPGDLEDVMHRVKEGDIYSEGPYRLLRINNPAEILGYKLNLNG